MRSEALKKSQMNPKILMMKKNDRIDRNNNLTSTTDPKTFDKFKSTNPRVRADAAKFLEKIRDPFTKHEDDGMNNYDDIHDLK